jgi:hypothetical protein
MSGCEKEAKQSKKMQNKTTSDTSPSPINFCLAASNVVDTSVSNPDPHFIGFQAP